MALAALASSCGGGASRAEVIAPEALCEAVIQPGPSALRRLTRDEYDATVRDLLGDDSRPASSFPPDEDGLGFEVGATVSPLLAGRYMRAAEDVAARAVRERLDALVPCDPRASGEEECARAFLARFGRRAYRRPLEAAQLERLMEVYRAGAAEGAFEDGVRLVLTAMLQSPHFLYRVELAPAGAAVPLTTHERASRLSYFLWGTMPDEALFDAADRGELATPDEVEAQARRMLADPRARSRMRRFAAQWLELELGEVTKDEAVHPEWSPELAASMEASALRLVEAVVFESSGTLRELLTARYAFVDGALAPIFGVPAPERPGLWRVPLDPSERAGILTHPAVLSRQARPAESSPVLRGNLVRERLLCHVLPPPPEALMVTAPDPDPSASTRARYEEHRANPACVTCHELMDPIGFALERYDAIGRHRLEDQGFAVDARGEITGTRASDGPIDGAVELAHALADSPDVQRCFTEQVWAFAFGHTEAPEDACSLEGAHRAFVASGGDVRELLVAIARSDAFLHHRGGAP